MTETSKKFTERLKVIHQFLVERHLYWVLGGLVVFWNAWEDQTIRDRLVSNVGNLLSIGGVILVLVFVYITLVLVHSIGTLLFLMESRVQHLRVEEIRRVFHQTRDWMTTHGTNKEENKVLYDFYRKNFGDFLKLKTRYTEIGTTQSELVGEDDPYSTHRVKTEKGELEMTHVWCLKGDVDEYEVESLREESVPGGLGTLGRGIVGILCLSLLVLVVGYFVRVFLISN
jgi:hypothetical protein